jgi:hemolysin III
MFVMKLRDPVSALTHWGGVALAVVGLIDLTVNAALRGTVWHVVSYAVFGASMILLYAASATYHSVPQTATGTANRVLRKLDHTMIYILIAGTYTPFCLVPLRGAWGWALFGTIWGCALAGLFMSLFWLHAPRWLSTTIYVIMGWLVVFATYPLMQSVSAACLALLFAGGITYTLGAVFYATKRPTLWPGVFGFHEVWHLFVLGGTIFHYFAIRALL